MIIYRYHIIYTYIYTQIHALYMYKYMYADILHDTIYIYIKNCTTMVIRLHIQTLCIQIYIYIYYKSL